MKKLAGKTKYSLKELLKQEHFDNYTKQTIKSLFRALLEPVVETNENAVALVRVKNDDFNNILTRLGFSQIKTFNCSNINLNSKFDILNVNELFENDEQFLILLADRFSAILYFDEKNTSLIEGFCSLNPDDVKTVISYIQDNTLDARLENAMSELKLDRRGNEKFTSIIRKLSVSMENSERDLICATEEVKNLQDTQDKSIDMEKYLASMAHELRNPLSIIDLQATILSKRADKLNNIEEQELQSLKNSINSISKATETMSVLLTELIEYNKPVKLNLEKNDISAEIQSTIDFIKPLLEEKSIAIEFLANKTGQNAYFDKIKLHQVVLNLLKNAAEAQNENSKISVKLNVTVDIEILVKDEGCGIDIESLNKLFLPYFTTKKSGTGLGLYVSKKIIEAHNGTLSLVSTGKNGTTFSIKLPLN